jgi:hypothetical protein
MMKVKKMSIAFRAIGLDIGNAAANPCGRERRPGGHHRRPERQPG